MTTQLQYHHKNGCVSASWLDANGRKNFATLKGEPDAVPQTLQRLIATYAKGAEGYPVMEAA